MQQLRLPTPLPPPPVRPSHGATHFALTLETAKMNSHPWTSYSTSYTLWGLSRCSLAVLRCKFTIAPIISGVGLRNFARSQCANRTLRRIQRRVTNFWVHSSVICLQLSIAATPVNNTRYKRSLHLKNVARQRASLSAQNTILAFLSTPVQKTGG